MLRLAGGLLLTLLACQPKQPLQPSFYTQKRAENAPLTCKETIDCYAQCQPIVEECLLRCDQRSSAAEIERARAVANCSAQNSCAADRTCEQEQCAAPLEVCVAPRPAAAAPSPMRPQPYPGQQVPPPHGEPQPPGPR